MSHRALFLFALGCAACGGSLAAITPLESSFDIDLALEAVKELEEFEDPIIVNSDVMSVKKTAPGKCYVKVQGTKNLEDWIHNLEFYKATVKSVKCRLSSEEPGRCTSYRTVGRGMDGFVMPYNSFRLEMWAQMKGKCDLDHDVFIFAGHSRGGAIAQVISSVMYLENLIPKERMRLVTFGTPRVLQTDLSDKVNDKFKQLRLINEADPVPSVPPSAFGFFHFGKMRCNACGYPMTRDEPEVGSFWDVTDHYLENYHKWIASLAKEIEKAESIVMALT